MQRKVQAKMLSASCPALSAAMPDEALLPAAGSALSVQGKQRKRHLADYSDCSYLLTFLQ